MVWTVQFSEKEQSHESYKIYLSSYCDLKKELKMLFFYESKFDWMNETCIEIFSTSKKSKQMSESSPSRPVDAFDTPLSMCNMNVGRISVKTDL